MKEQQEKSYSHILKYTGIFGGVQGIGILISLVRNKAMALLLGAGGMGFNALLMSVQNFASQCTNLGISFGAVPRLSELYEQGDEERLTYNIKVIRTWSVIAALLGFAFCVIVSPLMNDWSFSWGDHTLHYAFLGFAVAMAAITGGEMAVLKAQRQLGALAKIQLITSILGVLLSVPIYYFFGHRGVAPAIVLLAFVGMLVTISYSYRLQRLQLSFQRDCLKDGFDILKLGVAFALAAVIGSAAEMFIRSYLNIEGGLDDVGLYNAAYMITITYAGMVFTAMDTDYFPRLSGVAHDIEATNETVNKQMEVSLLLLAPMLVALLAALPILIPLLFTSEFLPVVQMAQVAVLAMYFKVMTLPVAYITLARRLSMSYIFLETSYFVALVAAIAVGFYWWGIWGTGLAIVVAHVFEYVLVTGYAYRKYGYRTTRQVFRYVAVQMGIGFTAYAVSLTTEGWFYWIIEAALTVVSTAYSIHVLRQKTHLWQALRKKFF